MSIRIGISSGLTAPHSPDDYWRWVDLCEEAGIDSIWHSDQLVGPGVEPIAMLAALAARTKRLRFGTNALVVPYRDPLVVAKQFATIAFLAPGRLLPVFGVGGPFDPYWAATGQPPKTRGQRSNEAIILIRALLEQENVSFTGAHFRYEGAGVSPRPAKPLPLWIGGDSEAAIQRSAAMGDGWLGGFTTPATAADVVARIRAALLETGRSIDADHYGVTVPVRIGGAQDPAVTAQLRARLKIADDIPDADLFATGSPEQVVALFRRFVEAGISKFVALPIAHDPADLLEQTRLVATEILPQVEQR
ncbi:LLM class flavin-dependent oxidoreductase [Sphingobium sp. AN558]|uniref:LLM class flavin-dependent oxidoreductase n=1 Tax=Sphingobium sp. AN558 TaxID=3133442 RepID=UPI0030BE535F